MIVLDASVLANAFTDDGPVGVTARTELARDARWAGPEHLVMEVFSAVRGHGEDAGSASDALATRSLHWQPRPSTSWQPDPCWTGCGTCSSVSGYDAAYIAVAETLDCALVTADARVSRVSDLRCEIKVALPTT